MGCSAFVAQRLRAVGLLAIVPDAPDVPEAFRRRLTGDTGEGSFALPAHVHDALAPYPRQINPPTGQAPVERRIRCEALLAGLAGLGLGAVDYAGQIFRLRVAYQCPPRA